MYEILTRGIWPKNLEQNNTEEINLSHESFNVMVLVTISVVSHDLSHIMIDD